MAISVSIAQLIKDNESSIGLVFLAGENGLERTILVPRVQKPGLALAGYDEQLHDDRLLTLGATEIEYLRTSSAAQRALGIATVMASSPACIVITRDLVAPPEVIAACHQNNVPLLSTQLISSEFIAKITTYLQTRLSPSSSVHGVFIDVLGVGILLLGKSGIGKSEAALELIAREHRLVADDLVHTRRIGPNCILGTGDEMIRFHMEIRGLGIINIKELFGINAVCEEKQVELVIELCEWDAEGEYDRIGVEDKFYPILGEELPHLRIPIRPGRSVSTIIEVAARNHLLKRSGHHTARIFTQKLSNAIRSTGSSSP